MLLRATPGVLQLLLAQVPGFVPFELPGVRAIITVSSCQLMPHEGTFQLQTDLPSIAAKSFSKLGENFKTLNMIFKLKLGCMTKE